MLRLFGPVGLAKRIRTTHHPLSLRRGQTIVDTVDTVGGASRNGIGCKEVAGHRGNAHTVLFFKRTV